MTELGDWVLGEPIGHGSGTVVHRGHHRLHPDRVVAIKRLRGTGVEVDDIATVQSTIEREAQVLRQLAHPAIMPVSDVVPDGAGIALVMPLATGGSLAARIRSEGALSWQDVADLGARIAGGLAAAHGAGIVHRDVTPTNIVYGRELEPRLADFGAALMADDDQRVVGTAGYIDPMVPRGTVPGPASDVYGLGVVLYEALAGQPPFAGATPEATMRAADRGIHLPLAALAPDAPGNLAAIIEQAMQRDAAGRFSSAQQLQVALEHVALTATGDDAAGSWAPPLPPPQWASRDVDAAAGSDASGAAVAGADSAAASGVHRAEDTSSPSSWHGDAATIPGARARQVEATHVHDAPGPTAHPVAMPPTTDYGPRPMAPLEIEDSPRPWWMVVLLVAVVVLPLSVAAWALFANRGSELEPTPPAATASSIPEASTAGEPSPTGVASPTPTAPATADDALVARTPKPLCEGQPQPKDGQLVGDVDGRGCALTITVQAQPDVTNLVMPEDAGPLAGNYALQGPPLAVVLGDWDGDGIDTPAVTLDADGTVWAFPAWDATQSEPIDDPIGPALPVVVTDAAGVDHVVATGDA